MYEYTDCVIQLNAYVLFEFKLDYAKSCYVRNLTVLCCTQKKLECLLPYNCLQIRISAIFPKFECGQSEGRNGLLLK